MNVLHFVASHSILVSFLLKATRLSDSTLSISPQKIMCIHAIITRMKKGGDWRILSNSYETVFPKSFAIATASKISMTLSLITSAPLKKCG